MLRVLRFFKPSGLSQLAKRSLASEATGVSSALAVVEEEKPNVIPAKAPKFTEEQQTLILQAANAFVREYAAPQWDSIKQHFPALKDFETTALSSQYHTLIKRPGNVEKMKKWTVPAEGIKAVNEAKFPVFTRARMAMLEQAAQDCHINAWMDFDWKKLQHRLLTDNSMDIGFFTLKVTDLKKAYENEVNRRMDKIQSSEALTVAKKKQLAREAKRKQMEEQAEKQRLQIIKEYEAQKHLASHTAEGTDAPSADPASEDAAEAEVDFDDAAPSVK